MIVLLSLGMGHSWEDLTRGGGLQLRPSLHADVRVLISHLNKFFEGRKTARCGAWLTKSQGQKFSEDQKSKASSHWLLRVHWVMTGISEERGWLFTEQVILYLLDYWTPPRPKSPFGEHLTWDTSIFILHPFSDTPFPDVSHQFSNHCLSKSLWSSRQSIDYGPWISEQLHIWPFLQFTAQCSCPLWQFPFTSIFQGFPRKGL